MKGWLVAFLITQAIEVPVWTLALSRDGPARSRLSRLELAFLASLATHPAAWILAWDLARRWPGGPEEGRWVSVALAELFAWAVEARLMHHAGLARAAWWSLAANLLSFGLGKVVVGWL